MKDYCPYVNIIRLKLCQNGRFRIFSWSPVFENCDVGK